jgi:nitrate reductase gamma subunit
MYLLIPIIVIVVFVGVGILISNKIVERNRKFREDNEKLTLILIAAIVVAGGM